MSERVITMGVSCKPRSTGVQVKQGVGAAQTAKRLQTPRNIAIGGAAKGRTLFDGSEDVEIFTVLETMSNEELEGMLK